MMMKRGPRSYKNTFSSIDGSHSELAGQSAACGWAVEQLDFDGGSEPWFAMNGTLHGESGAVQSPRSAERSCFEPMHVLIGGNEYGK